MTLSKSSNQCGYSMSASMAIMSPSVTMPTSLPSTTTGTPPIRCSRNIAARSLTDMSGSTVTTGVVMMSRTSASGSSSSSGMSSPAS